jgi:hypothetical protein
MLSPIFKAMLTSGFREASETNSEIPLPDDDPEGLLFLLRIAHLKFKDLPKSLSFQDLYHVAILCDKYDAVHIAKPFWSQYSSPHLRLAKAVGFEEWMFIAWTFGIEDIYSRTVKNLILHGKFRTQFDGDSKRRTLMIKERAVEEILPPYILGKIFLAPMNVNLTLPFPLLKTITMHGPEHHIIDDVG